ELALRRRLVQPPLAPRLPLEVLHRIRDIGPGAIDSGLAQALVQDAARGPDERMAFPVFHVARLLAHEHDAGARIALAEDRLRRIGPEGAILAPGGFTPKAEERG